MLPNRFGEDGISIHSLRVEGDIDRIYRLRIDAPFQSTPSVWRETYVLCRR